MEFNYNYKHIILCDTLTGKTSYFNKLLYNKYISDKITTIGVDFGVQFLNINGKIIKNHFWDTAGQEKYKSIIRSYYRGIMGCIIMFDLTNLESFHNINKWLNELKYYGKYENLSIIVLGNKSDLKENIKVNLDLILDYCNNENLDYFEISVKDNINIKESFEHLVKLISQKENHFELSESNSDKKLTFEIIEYKKKPKKCMDCVIS